MANKDTEKKSLMEQYRESQESAFIREVKAEATRERFEKIWHKHKYLIIAFVALPILISLAVNMYDSHNRRVAQREAAIYSELASIADDATRIDRAIDFAASARSVYRDVAYQAIYSAQLAQGNKEAAVATLRLAIRNARDASFKNAAIIKLALEPGFEDNKEKIKLLGSIGRRKPLYHIARLTLALIHAREGHDAESIKILESIVGDKNTPPDVRDQAASMSEYLKARKMV